MSVPRVIVSYLQRGYSRSTRGQFFASGNEDGSVWAVLCRVGLAPKHVSPNQMSTIAAMTTSSVFAFAALMTATLAGCASYTAGTGNRQLPGGYKDVAVPVFKNNTAEAGAEVYFTNAIVREFERSRVARVTDKDHAQVTAEGSIDSVQYLADSKIQQGQPGSPPEMPLNTAITTNYRIVLVASVRLRRNSDQAILWQGSFSSERAYLAPRVLQPGLNSVNPLYNQSARYQNIETMSADLMAEALNRMTENF